MRRLAVPAAVAALAAALLTSVSTAAGLPLLRSATARNGHVVVRFSLGELVPGRILVASQRTTSTSGRFPTANVRLNEALRSVKTATGYQARTRHALAPGTYYVQVSGNDLMVDCTKFKPCLAHWSNVRRVVVRGP